MFDKNIRSLRASAKSNSKAELFVSGYQKRSGPPQKKKARKAPGETYYEERSASVEGIGKRKNGSGSGSISCYRDYFRGLLIGYEYRVFASSYDSNFFFAETTYTLLEAKYLLEVAMGMMEEDDGRRSE